MKLQTDFGVELEPERGFVAVTQQVPPGLLRYLKNVATGAAFLEIVGSNMGKAQGIIQLSNGQQAPATSIAPRAGRNSLSRW